MEFLELIQKRRSIRVFLDRPVELVKLEQILQAANQAPSAGNLQAYEIYLVESLAQRAGLAQSTSGQDFILQAPVALVFCAHPARSEWRYRQRGVTLYSVQDATIACTFAMLAATDLGLGSVWVGAFNDRAVLDVLGNPEGLTPISILLIGYPAQEPSDVTRRSLKDLVHYG
jgi:nitroreductase